MSVVDINFTIEVNFCKPIPTQEARAITFDHIQMELFALFAILHNNN